MNKMEREDIEFFAKILIIAIFLVIVFAGFYIYYLLTFVPPEEIVININQLNLE